MSHSNRPAQQSCTPEYLARALLQMMQWPDSWKTCDADIEFGQDLIPIFEDFLTELYIQGLSSRTIGRHKSNLWELGGELIRRRSNGAVPLSSAAVEVLAHYVSEDGGPLLASRRADAEQQGLDATCRRLFDFLLLEVPGAQGASKPEA